MIPNRAFRLNVFLSWNDRISKSLCAKMCCDVALGLQIDAFQQRGYFCSHAGGNAS